MKASSTNVAWLQDSSSVRVGRDEHGAVVIEWSDFVRLTATEAAEVATLEPLKELAPAMLEKMRHGIARAIPEYLRGAVVLHGAAVATNGRALILLGDSGAGKSTAAALLCARGAALLADDSVVAHVVGDELVVKPLEKTHWLDAHAANQLGHVPSTETEKIAVNAHGASSAAPAAAIVVLEVGDLGRHRLHGIAATQAILSALLRLPLNRERSLADFEILTWIAATIPIFRVLRPAVFSATLTEQLTSSLFRIAHDPDQS